jgi:hypothetical protein
MNEPPQPRMRRTRQQTLRQRRWRRIGRQVLLIVGVIVAVVAVVFVINRFFVHRPLWDWLKLLIVPAVLAVVGLWFNAQQRDREQQIAAQRAQNDALQAYLDQMSDMLIPSKDQPSLSDKSPPESLRVLARARTLTVLPTLDGDRKARVLQFVYEAGLITKRATVIRLGGANLSFANLSFANLKGADLRHTNLIGADLRAADLSEAGLSHTFLSEADLRWTDLKGADLTWAHLINAKVNKEHILLVAKSLEGATMPDGQMYRYWLKSKGRGEEGENSGPS